MPLGPCLPLRGHRVSRAGCLLAAGAWLACSAPDGRGLFQPYATGGGSGSGGRAGSPGAPAGTGGGLGSGSGTPEGQGGRLPLAGAAGTSAAGTSAAGAVSDDAGPPEEADIDAGSTLDATAPPPVTCLDPGVEVCDGIDNDCDGTIDPGPTCPDGCAGFVLAEHGYMFCVEGVDRGIALSSCEVEGMKLAWVETQEENEGLLASIAVLDVAVAGVELITQIGASDAAAEGEWRWVDDAAALAGFQFWEGNVGGESVDEAYESWAAGEPNDTAGEDCGALSVNGSANRQPGQWDDRNCDFELPFLCEAR